jgi:hypothetical protein
MKKIRTVRKFPTNDEESFREFVNSVPASDLMMHRTFQGFYEVETMELPKYGGNDDND